MTGETPVPRGVIFRGNNLTTAQMCMTDLSMYTYVCISNVYNYNLLLLCTSQKLLLFSSEVLGTAQRVCEERMISGGANALRECSHGGNKCQGISQAAVSLSVSSRAELLPEHFLL